MRNVGVFLDPEVVGVNERADGEGFVEEVITISRKRVIGYVFFFFRRSVPSPCVDHARGCARSILCVRALMFV